MLAIEGQLENGEGNGVKVADMCLSIFLWLEIFRLL